MPRSAQGAPPQVIVTCEHASCSVPEQYSWIAEPFRRLIATHRGWDPGALAVAKAMAKTFDAPLHAAQHSRLLCDANRTEDHADLFSVVSCRLSPSERERMLAELHRPHWARVRAHVKSGIATGSRIVHLAPHTFTPILRGEVRRVQLGLLYDPSHALESLIASRLRRHLAVHLPQLRVAMNEPYAGVSNALPTALRGEFPRTRYAGLEFELNQQLLDSASGFRRVTDALCQGLVEVLHGLQHPDASD